MQEIVGGLIEIIRIKDLAMVCNEEGKLIGLETNPVATIVAQFNGINDLRHELYSMCICVKTCVEQVGKKVKV